MALAEVGIFADIRKGVRKLLALIKEAGIEQTGFVTGRPSGYGVLNRILVCPDYSGPHRHFNAFWLEHKGVDDNRDTHLR